MIDRRRFLTLAALAAARVLAPGRAASEPRPQSAGATGAPKLSPPAASSTADCNAGLAVAKQQILKYCATLAFPNGAVHAVRALGRTCPLGAGDPFRLLLETCLVENPIGGRMFLEVPVEKEGHRNAMLKTLLEKGCEPELQFELHDRRYTFQNYIDSARLLASYPGNLAIDEHSWTIMAMALTVPPAQARWTNAWGATVDLDRMIDDTSAQLERDTELVRRVDLTKKDPPRDCPALGRACGGLHMLYALAVALGSGYETPARRTAFAAHLRTLGRRMVYDMSVTDSVERENIGVAGEEAAHIVAYDSRVKFLGHVLEIVGLVDRKKLYEFSAAERRQLQAARARLCQVLAEGKNLKLERYQGDAFLYDSLTTGICHAYNGLLSAPQSGADSG